MPKITTNSQRLSQSYDLIAFRAHHPMVAHHASCATSPLRRAGASIRSTPFEKAEGGEHYDEANSLAVLAEAGRPAS